MNYVHIKRKIAHRYRGGSPEKTESRGAYIYIYDDIAIGVSILAKSRSSIIYSRLMEVWVYSSIVYRNRVCVGIEKDPADLAYLVLTGWG